MSHSFTHLYHRLGEGTPIIMSLRCFFLLPSFLLSFLFLLLFVLLLPK